MDDVRLANMFYEQRGPLVFSASVHLTLLVVVAVWVLFFSEQEKEPFQFEMVPPPSGGATAQPSQSQPTLDDIKYDPVEDTMPTLDDIQLPERPVRTVEVERPPEPVVEREQPVIEVAPPKPAQMSLDDFLKQNPDANKVKNVRTTPSPTTRRPKIDVPQFEGIQIGSLPAAEIASYSQADQDALGSYIAGFKASLKRAVASHPSRGTKLSASVICDILANGSVRNVRIVRSSGDGEFDRKVLAGYGRLSSYARPPKGQALMGLQIEFVQQ
ncbi:TonB family protein [Pelagicoccus sp. SDUM812002]|uniref:energy transducer TonB family protein n=1 Tax=Pelagicoccus sp. SDUM812002 TaxID=3041266 RepID=UPI0028103D1C|nr:TonB family protein [Pelagicoccus sp. SDUM812002]MDQ8184351.1 TonB family protein [Pelagicoccus sp. SDUM812002]